MSRPNARCRWTRRYRDLALLTALALSAAQVQSAACASPSTAPPAASQDQDLYLEVTLNQARHPQLLHFVRRGQGLYAGTDTLRGLGFALPDAAAPGLRALDDFAGVRWQYDAGRQQLAIDAPLALLALPTTTLNPLRDDGPAPASTAPGALVNYDVYTSRQDDAAGNFTATAELRVFGFGDGVFSNTANTRSQHAAGAPWRTDAVRLDSTWDLSFPEREITASVGDSFSGFLNWTRPVRLGGIQLGRNFSLQPYRITTPLPGFLGEAVVPSTIELYVNGLRQYSGEVPVGPFQLTTMPGITGAGDAQIVITDAFGRTRTLDFPFYSTQQLLARGLSDWSVSAGVVREDYGLRSFSYASAPLGSGNLRYGVSDRFTAEAHAEGGDGLANGGMGGLWLLGRAGVVSASVAGSTRTGRSGTQTAAGYRWNNRRFNASADTQRTRGDYQDIAARHGAPVPTVSERAQAGINTSRLGNLSVSYVRLSAARAGTARFGGAFWSRSFARNWSAHIAVNQNLDDAQDRSVYFGISIGLGDEHHASASWQRDGGRASTAVDVSRPVPGDGGYGWRVQARNGDDAGSGLAEAAVINDVGRYGVGVASFGDASYGYASASGGLVLMGGHAFASRNIPDAFAVVSTDGVAGVPVKLENRLIGHTDDAGMLLVPRLNAWQRNKLSIDPMDLPANVRVSRVDAVATPRDRSGTRVRFGITPVRAAVVVLHDRAGKPLALGSRVQLEGAGDGQAVVGHDGETYLDTLAAHNRLRVETPTGVCTAGFDYPQGGDTIPRIGPLTCTMQPSP